MAAGADFPDDASAVAAALGGREQGYVWLMGRHRASVFRFVRGHVGHDEEALDLTQECFVSAFAALKRYDPARPFRRWLLAIAVNKCRDWGRKRAVRRFFTFARPLDEASSIADPAFNPEEALAAEMGVEQIRAALARLPASLSGPLLLCSIEGMSQEEVAEVLGISRKAVETRIYRARKRLSELLKE
ncbi:RNA polymerase sigma factor [Altererythrobacter sp.]|uniref:RNA polymerase sigma factor n=1 Tax=Altererythrobacter sp. TaxID=1872480 RepID=UPI003D09314A